MLNFATKLLKFNDKGEKTGWTYILITASQAEKLNPGVKTSYRVKGKIDAYAIEQVALLPMGEGHFIMAINATMRRYIKKPVGSPVQVSLALDKKESKLSSDFLSCLEEEPEALVFFKELPPGHQRYFSNWIESAKTETTKVKRITQAIQALAMGLGFSGMVRYFKSKD